MLVRWFGHSSFLIISRGKKILTDPYDSSVGYPLKFPQVDVITVSHDHFDHSFVQAVPGYKEVMKGKCDKNYEGFYFKGIESFHDDVKGAKRGKNTIFKITVEDMSVVHLGDLGTTLSKTQIKEIGATDILMIPVGGVYTVGPKEADEIVKQLEPKIVLPMHYKTEYLKFPLLSVEDFLKGKEYSTTEALEVEKNTLPQKTETFLLRLPF